MTTITSISSKDCVRALCTAFATRCGLFLVGMTTDTRGSVHFMARSNKLFMSHLPTLQKAPSFNAGSGFTVKIEGPDAAGASPSVCIRAVSAET